ncbi:MAG TPA: cytochrome P450 [Acidimicrobiales bacterium]|nr:cytochrome P450 [Acidimicrobiales bacterium]
MTVSVHELDLPLLETVGLDRDASLRLTADARRRSWLARTAMGFSVTTHEDARTLLRDRRFHSALSLLPSRAGLEPGGYLSRRRRSILSMDGIEHTRLRRLVSPAFTPAAAERHRPFIRETICELVDRVSPRGWCDLVPEVCEPYPIPVICKLLGAPRDDWRLFSRWATDIFRIFNQDLETDLPAIESASTQLDAYVRAMVDERRRDPRGDLLSELIAVEEAGDRLSTDELVMLAEAVLMAGTDTTRNQLGCSVALFAEHPAQWRLLGDHPELARQAAEETMRFLGAVRGTARVAAEDVEYRGVMFPKGTFVSFSLSGSNRDDAAFAEPDTFDITAERAVPHLTFGWGIHHCLGAALARVELQEALAVLAQRLPDLLIDGVVEWKPATFGIWGPVSLPLRFTPTPASMPAPLLVPSPPSVGAA